MKKARILIDATGVSIGGGYTFLVNAIPRLCEREPNLEIRVLVRSRIDEEIPARPNLEVITLPSVGVVKRLQYLFLSLPGVASRWGADLFFSVGEMVPLWLSCPSIASFRNAAVFSWDVKASMARDRLRLNILWVMARISAIRASRILFVSKCSADWIGDSIRLAEERRAVLYHGIDVAAWSKITPYRGHPRPYILAVGTIYSYKNYVRLIEAYAALAARNPETPDLIVIGDEYDAEHQAQMNRARHAAGSLRDKIHIVGKVSHFEVPSYFKGASLFVFPSYLETFGQPLLEAMAADVPIVAADIPAFREIAGDAAIYADPYDVSALSQSIEEALRPEVAAELLRRGSARAKQFTLERTVEGLTAIFESVLGAG